MKDNPRLLSVPRPACLQVPQSVLPGGGDISLQEEEPCLGHSPRHLALLSPADPVHTVPVVQWYGQLGSVTTYSNDSLPGQHHIPYTCGSQVSAASLSRGQLSRMAAQPY